MVGEHNMESEKSELSGLETKILVIMDNPSSSFIDELMNRKYDITLVNNIADGIDIVKREKFNLVIADIQGMTEGKMENPANKEAVSPLFILNELPDKVYPGEVISVIKDPKSVGELAVFSNFKYFLTRESTGADIVRVLDRALEDAKVHEQMSAIPDPLDALFNEAIKAITRGDDPETVEHAHQQLRRILKERPDENYPYSSIITAYAYEELKDIISTETIYSLKPGRLSTPIILKGYKSKRRAKCEFEAFSRINKYETERKVYLNSLALPDNEKYYWKHAPKINIKRLLYMPHLSQDFIFIGRERIRGPTLGQLADELTSKITKGDFKAREFKRTTIFWLNTLIAWLHTNISLDISRDENYENTDYTANLKETFAENLQFLNTSFSSTEISCLKKCIAILADPLKEFNDTQYLDFNWRNIVFDAGNDSACLDDLLELAEKEGKPIKEFVKDRLYKIDYNKTYRKTNIFEDLRHNFSNMNIKHNERNWIDNHFLLYRRKFALLKKFKSSMDFYLEHRAEVENICRLISALENNRVKSKKKAEINEIIRKEKDVLLKIDMYTSLYRDFRWFDHVLRKYLSRAVSESEQGRDRKKEIAKLEKELNFYCSNAKKYLTKITNIQGRHLSNKYVSRSDHKFLNNADLNRDTAQEYISKLEILKNGDSNGDKLQSAQEYVAAKYMLTVMKKIGRPNINYSLLVKHYKDE